MYRFLQGSRPVSGLFVPKFLYFLYYAAAAAWIPYLNLYYEQRGLSPSQIGLLAGLPALISLASAALWGGIADRTHRHKQVLVLAICSAVTAVLLLSRANTFSLLIPLIALYAFFVAPIMPLIDNAVLGLLGANKNRYGRLRLWGAVGWGVAAPLVGLLVDRTGLHWIFFSYAALMLGNLLLILRLPVDRTSVGQSFWRGFHHLLTNKRWVLFLLSVLIGSIGRAMINNFLFLYMDGRGVSKGLMGLSLAVASISELPIYFFSTHLLKRWGSRGLLVFALIASVLQPFAYSLVTAPWLFLLAQLLHGPSFSAMQVAGVSYADEIAPDGMGATAQGVFSSVIIGLASLLGAVIGGVLYQSVGAVAIFRSASAFALLGLSIFVGANKCTMPRWLKRS